MKVRLLVEMSGTRDGQAWPPRGVSFDLPDVEAMELCASRMAAPVADLNGSVETRPADSAGGLVDVEIRDDAEPLMAAGSPLVRRGPGRPRKEV